MIHVITYKIAGRSVKMAQLFYWIWGSLVPLFQRSVLMEKGSVFAEGNSLRGKSHPFKKSFVVVQKKQGKQQVDIVFSFSKKKIK